jgi:heme exporter protein D
MHFETFSDFIHMGGHGPFVWSVYALGISILLINVIRPSMLKRRFLKEQTRLMKSGLKREGS